VQPNRVADKHVVGFTFAGVVVDLRRQTLNVDGAEVSTNRQVLRLLQLLCEADGHVLKRQDVFDRVWPGGQDVSDSALSQLVWRLRSALGPYGSLVATVRGRGVRLDAAVSTDVDFQRGSSRIADPDPPSESVAKPRALSDIDAPAGNAAALVPRVPIARSNRRRLVLVVLAVAVLVVAGLGTVAWWSSNPVVIPAYALRSSDVQASRPDTAAGISAAFVAHAAGENSHAIALMRGVNDADTATPIPALYLAWWESDAATTTPDWIAQSRQRFTSRTGPYVRLLADYFEARRDDRSMRGPVDALLDLRPDAWALQYARAHDQIATHELTGALRSLRQIDVRGLDPSVVAEVLADRFALGDTTAEHAVGSDAAIWQDPVLSHFLRGRIAYSQRQLDAAIREFDQSAAEAEASRQYARQREGAIDGAIAALEAKAPDTVKRLTTAGRLCHDQDAGNCEVEMLALQAFALAHSDQAAAQAALAAAWQRNHHGFLAPPLLFVALENGLAAPGDVDSTAQQVPAESVFGGVSELLHAWNAKAEGDDVSANKWLALSVERGIERTYHAEDATLLRARLGMPAEPCRVDPPFPNVLRISACVALAESQDQATR